MLAQIQERLWNVLFWTCSELRWEQSHTTSSDFKIQHNFQVSPTLCRVLDQMITRGTLHSELLYFMIRPKPCRHPKNREKLWDHTCGRDFSKEILVMDVLYRKIFQWNSHSTIQHKCILSLASALVLPKLFSVMWILPLTLQVTENCPTRHLVVIESLLCCCDLQHM